MLDVGHRDVIFIYVSSCHTICYLCGMFSAAVNVDAGTCRLGLSLQHNMKEFLMKKGQVKKSLKSSACMRPAWHIDVM